VKAWWRKAQALLTVFYAEMVEYRAEIFLWTLASLLPFIMMGIWIKAGAGGQFPLNSVQFARYFLAVFVVRQLTVAWVIWEFEYQVVQGRLSPYLLQPLDPVWRYVAAHLSERLARLPLLAALVVIFFLLYPKALWVPSPQAVLLAVPVVAAAFALRFIAQYTFAMFAFWTERASSIEQFWFLFYVFVSGMIAPLDVFPDLVRRIALFTPFPYLIYFPAELLVGNDVNIVRGFGVMLAWTAAFFILNRLLWRAGLKRYSAMGA